MADKFTFPESEFSFSLAPKETICWHITNTSSLSDCLLVLISAPVRVRGCQHEKLNTLINLNRKGICWKDIRYLIELMN